jgi:nucleoside-diphosphate-sugar epimerase
MVKTALVCGAGGFIGSHMVKRLVGEGYWVRGVDLKAPEFSATEAHDFIGGDLTDKEIVKKSLQPEKWFEDFDEVYQFAADMGGAGYIFSGVNDAHVMYNSSMINLNILEELKNRSFSGLGKPKPVEKLTKIFYSSSACMYPEYNQEDPNNPNCKEDSAYPAMPDSEYGWEKLFSERLYFAYNRNHNIPVCVARFHNIFGPEGTWQGGKEKAPAALCRKIANVRPGGEIEIWGDGEQTRSFLYIDECVEGVRRLIQSKDFFGPVNIGSEEMVTINQLAKMIGSVSNKTFTIKHIEGPLGVRGRNSDNALINQKLGWSPSQPLEDGLIKTYNWVSDKVTEKLNQDLYNAKNVFGAKGGTLNV